MTNEFKFTKNDNVGNAGAEEDREFLDSCYVDTGDLAQLKDLDNNKFIIIGRTGSGKSALLSRMEIEEDRRVISIDPESLAMAHISNSNVLKFFENLGVNLDPFYKLLWRHVFVVEVLKSHFDDDELKSSNLLSLLSGKMGLSKSKKSELKRAVDYLVKWGDEFWIETEKRVVDITSRFEDSLKTEASLALQSKPFEWKSGVDLETNFSEEEKALLKDRGTKVVAEAQVSDLKGIISVLDSILSDKEKSYFILVDRLDEDWVEEKLRFGLIMALIETQKNFIKIERVKIIVALRRDLIDRVFRVLRGSGSSFQEEKYNSLYLPLYWSKEVLLDVLDRRIAKLVKYRYTKQEVTHKEFLPQYVDGVPISNYIYSRAKRPRDIIDYFNCCISAAVRKNLSRLDSDVLKVAEAEYSKSRLGALFDEWGVDYPNLPNFVGILKDCESSFVVKDLSDEKVSRVLENLLEGSFSAESENGLLAEDLRKYFDSALGVREVLFKLIYHLYKIGLVGLKTISEVEPSWSEDLGSTLMVEDVCDNTTVVIHPAFYCCLGVPTLSIGQTSKRKDSKELSSASEIQSPVASQTPQSVVLTLK